MFCERLKEYRNEMNIKTKREMAELLNVSEQLYAMVERGDRKPSKSFLRKLVIYSKKPEEYWIYGVKNVGDLKNIDSNLAHTKDTVLELIDRGYIKDSNIEKYNDEIVQILLAALKIDICTILLKKENNKN